MKQPKVSIIVTIHNSEKYIRECLASACNQTFQEIEILCIDGGSTDSTPEILIEMQKVDERIIIINDNNTSYGHKVNRGIQEAKGKYVSILESDDCYYENMIEVLYTLAEEMDADFVDGDLYRCFTYCGKWLGIHEDKYSKKCYYNKLVDNNWEDGVIFCSGAIYTCLYRKDFLLDNNIFLHESQGASYQDVGFAFLTHTLAKRTYHVNQPVYMYRNDNEGSSIYNCKKVFEIVREFEFVKEQFEKRCIDKPLIWKQFYITKYGCYLDRLNYMYHKGRKLFLDAMVKEMSKDIEEKNISISDLVDIYGEAVYGLYPDSNRMLAFYEDLTVSSLPERVCMTLNSIGENPCVICGAGKMGRELLHYLRQNGNVVYGMCDNAVSIQNTFIEDIPVKKVEELVALHATGIFIIANQKHGKEIQQQLISLGIKDNQMVFYR